VPTFDAEVEALQRHGISLDAWWFPTERNDEARLILDVCKRHSVHPQLWVMGGGDPAKTPEEQRARIETEAKRLRHRGSGGANRGKVGLTTTADGLASGDQLAIIGRLARVIVTYRHHLQPAPRTRAPRPFPEHSQR
jgi:hypothetical protein